VEQDLSNYRTRCLRYLLFVPTTRTILSSLYFLTSIDTFEILLSTEQEMGYAFLQYLFHRKLDNKLFCVQNLNQSLAYIAWDTSNIDLNPSPISCYGRQILSHVDQCLFLPTSLLLQKNFAIIL